MTLQILRHRLHPDQVPVRVQKSGLRSDWTMWSDSTTISM